MEHGFNEKPNVLKWEKGKPVLVILDEITRKNICDAEKLDPFFNPSIALFLKPDHVGETTFGLINNSEGEYILIAIDPDTDRPFTVKVRPNKTNSHQRPYLVARGSIYPITQQNLEVLKKTLEINATL